MCVYRSLNNIYVQIIIDDTAGKTLVSASSVEPAFGSEGGNKEKCQEGRRARGAARSKKRASPRSCSTVAVTLPR